jgi:signal transduction histidine kinase
MGQGYWVLVADGFASGLNLINPRLLEVSGQNWWPASGDDLAIVRAAWERHDLGQYAYAKVIV